MMNRSYNKQKGLRYTVLFLALMFVIAGVARGQTKTFQSKHFAPLNLYAYNIFPNIYTKK